MWLFVSHGSSLPRGGRSPTTVGIKTPARTRKSGSEMKKLGVMGTLAQKKAQREEDKRNASPKVLSGEEGEGGRH